MSSADLLLTLEGLKTKMWQHFERYFIGSGVKLVRHILYSGITILKAKNEDKMQLLITVQNRQ